MRGYDLSVDDISGSKTFKDWATHHFHSGYRAAYVLSVQSRDHLVYVIAHGGFDRDATGGCSCETCADLRKRIASVQKREGEQYYAERTKTQKVSAELGAELENYKRADDLSQRRIEQLETDEVVAERDLAAAQARITTLRDVLKEDLIMLAGILLSTQWELSPVIRAGIQKAHDLTMEALAEPPSGGKE